MLEPPVSQNVVPNPQVLIDGKPYRSSTFPIESPRNGLPIIDENDEDSKKISLGELLRKYAVEGADESKGSFWPLALLRHILSRDRILTELHNYLDQETAETYLNIIRPEDDHLSASNSQTYLRTFALLVLFQRGCDICKFVKEEVSDQHLPVCRHLATIKGKVNLCRKDMPKRPLQCFEKWKFHAREDFESKQWRLLVPYFDLDSGDRAKHYILDDNTILPWCKWSERSHSSSQPSRQEGGYAVVSFVRIDQFSHGFRDILQEIQLNDDLFALKMLHDNNEAQFRNELEQLQRFNGLAHRHLVTLLATFTFQQKYYLLFPYASGTLEQYWEKKEQKPSMDIAAVRWVSEQCSGIMGAIDTIHDPKHLDPWTVKRYGRHGDIKPDNILWFCSSKTPKGILVVSDMGLSSFNRDTSRSNIPNDNIPKAPGYRPPECDVKGGTISRAYDIWTLGCLFLELLTWLLGGLELVEEFQEKRKSVYITGSVNNIFFTLKTIKGRDGYVAQVKPQVTKWFDKLHFHEKCSQFVHDALDIVQNEMLVVLSKDRRRSLSGDLARKFAEIHVKCINDSDYCVKKIPLRRNFRSATAVEAILNPTAEMMIFEHSPKLPTHDPTRDREMRESMLPEELENMDKI